jgi:hypothetical protein
MKIMRWPDFIFAPFFRSTVGTAVLICSRRSFFPQLPEQKSPPSRRFAVSTLLAKGINQEKTPTHYSK